jgi:hypothetical protein
VIALYKVSDNFRVRNQDQINMEGGHLTIKKDKHQVTMVDLMFGGGFWTLRFEPFPLNVG